MKALLASALLLPLILGAQPPLKDAWTVTDVAGPIGWPGQKLKLSLTGTGLSLTDPKARRNIAIPSDEITQVAYSRVRFSRASQLGGKYDNSGWMPANGSGCGYPGCGGAILIALIAVAVAAPMHGTSHFILLSWVDRDVAQQMQFEVGKSDAEALNARLRQLADARWVDVDQQRQAAQQEITEHGNQAIPIELDRDSWCGEFALPKGAYRVLVAGDSRDMTTYFFAESVELPQLRAILPARVAGEAGPSSFEYAAGSARIASIRWKGKSLQFPAK